MCRAGQMQNTPDISLSVCDVSRHSGKCAVLRVTMPGTCIDPLSVETILAISKSVLPSRVSL